MSTATADPVEAFARLLRDEPNPSKRATLLRRAELRAAKDVPTDALPDAPEDTSPDVRKVPNYPTDALTGAARELVEAGVRSGLAASFVGGAALAAGAAAIGSAATITPGGDWQERAALWVPLLGEPGSGKSPAQDMAFGPLRALDGAQMTSHRAALEAWRSGGSIKEERPASPRTLLMNDQTMEALVRSLDARGGTVAIDADELAQFLGGIGEYKRGGGDRGRMLALWDGAPWTYTRVGQGRDGANEVDIHLAAPTVTVCGGLQPGRLAVLGNGDDGLRSRWLLHAAPTATGDVPPLATEGTPATWATLLGDLVAARVRVGGEWTLSEDAREAFQRHRARWRSEGRSAGSVPEAEALSKADRQALRVALVLAEFQSPGGGGLVPAEVIDRAARIVDFSVACWAAQEGDGLALTWRDKALDEGVTRLTAWLRGRGGKATKREAQVNKVGGARTAADFRALIDRYAAVYPHAVTDKELFAPEAAP